MKIGDNLKRIRTEKGISQGSLAELLNMHAAHISRYERNSTTPSVEVLKRIADALNISIDELVYGKQEEKAKNKLNDNELLSMFHRVQTLNKSELTCVKSLLKAYIFQVDTQQRLAH